MKLISNKKVLFLISAITMALWDVAHAAEDNIYPDPEMWMKLQYYFETCSTGVAHVDFWDGDRLAEKRSIRMFYYSAGGHDRETFNWTNPCTVPIDVKREKYGTTTLQFHKKDGTPGIIKIFPKETSEHRVDLCMPKSNKTVLVGEYTYDNSDMLVRRIKMTYYDACGNVKFKESTKYSYSKNGDIIGGYEGCVGMNDDGSLLLLNYNQKDTSSKERIDPSSQHVGRPRYVIFDGTPWLDIELNGVKLTENTAYAFSPNSLYSCVLVWGRYRWSRDNITPPAMLSCVDLYSALRQSYPIGGNIWNLKVTDDGEVTANYRNKNDTSLEPNIIYTLKFQLIKRKYIWKKKK